MGNVSHGQFLNHLCAPFKCNQGNIKDASCSPVGGLLLEQGLEGIPEHE